MFSSASSVALCVFDTSSPWNSQCFVVKVFLYLFYRKASLALIRKMVHYSSEVLLKEVCDSDAGHNLPTVLVEITATVLDQEVG